MSSGSEDESKHKSDAESEEEKKEEAPKEEKKEKKEKKKEKKSAEEEKDRDLGKDDDKKESIVDEQGCCECDKCICCIICYPDKLKAEFVGPTDTRKTPSDWPLPPPEWTGLKGCIYKHIYDLTLLPCWAQKYDKDVWNIHACNTCCRAPIFWVLGCLCTPCYAFYQRKLVLGDDMQEKYRCCQGAYGKCWCTRCWRCTSWCPYIGLLIESFIWPMWSTNGNRTQMMYKWPVENRIIETIIFIVGSILGFFGFFSQIITCFFAACFSSQQEKEWMYREGETGLVPYLDWSESPNPKPGACWQCTKCEPCCGDPCNFMDGLYCFACWCCCGCCTLPKLFAFSNDQDCAFVDHCGPYIIATLLNAIFPPAGAAICCWLNMVNRHNLRILSEVGRSQDYFGDCVVSNFCLSAPCGMCQQLRAVPVEGWDWLKAMKDGKVSASHGKFDYIRGDSKSGSGGGGEEKKPEKKEKKSKKEKKEEKENDDKED